MPLPARADPVRLHYLGFAAGLRVVELGATLSFAEGRYDASLDLQTLGLVDAFAHADSVAEVHGAWLGEAAAPRSYDSHGLFHGEPHRMSIAWRDGQPRVLARLPEGDDGREEVAAPLRANTIDSLSAMMTLLHRVAVSGSCDGHARVFDGRRLSEIAAQTVGEVTLPPTSRSVFAGPALRCDFEGTLLAGFRHDDNRARAARPQHGSVWLAALAPGGPMVPVRVSFHTGLFGDTTMYLAP